MRQIWGLDQKVIAQLEIAQKFLRKILGHPPPGHTPYPFMDGNRNTFYHYQTTPCIVGAVSNQKTFKIPILPNSAFSVIQLGINRLNFCHSFYKFIYQIYGATHFNKSNSGGGCHTTVGEPLGEHRSWNFLKNREWLFERDVNKEKYNCPNFHLSILIKDIKASSIQITSVSLRSALISPHQQTMPSIYLKGRFCKLPLKKNHLYPCSVGQGEDIFHYVPHCLPYNKIRAILLVADELRGSNFENLNYLLTGCISNGHQPRCYFCSAVI